MNSCAKTPREIQHTFMLHNLYSMLHDCLTTRVEIEICQSLTNALVYKYTRGDTYKYEAI